MFWKKLCYWKNQQSSPVLMFLPFFLAHNITICNYKCYMVNTWSRNKKYEDDIIYCASWTVESHPSKPWIRTHTCMHNPLSFFFFSFIIKEGVWNDFNKWGEREILNSGRMMKTNILPSICPTAHIENHAGFLDLFSLPSLHMLIFLSNMDNIKKNLYAAQI